LHARIARGPALKRGCYGPHIDARLRGVRSRLKSGASPEQTNGSDAFFNHASA